MERRDDEASVTHEDRLAVVLREDLDLGAEVAHARCADENPPQRFLVVKEAQIGLEARDLPPVRVAVDVDVDQAEMAAVQDDHPRARSQNRRGKRAQRLVEAVQTHQAHESRRLATGHDEAAQTVELLGLANLDRIGPEPAQHRHVLAEVALDGQNTDPQRHYQPLVSSSSSAGIDAVDKPLIASPSPWDTRARISASV